MSYRLKKDESVGKGLERIVKKQLGSAIGQLTDEKRSDEAIHDARTSIKKVRAALRLVRDELAGSTRRDMQRLRRSGRLLSPLRDADATMETAKDLCRHDSAAVRNEACAAIRRHLARQKQDPDVAAVFERSQREAIEELRAVKRSMKDWDLGETRFSTLVKGLKRSYRQTRTAMSRARASRQATDFHRWRRRVKTLWYHARLFEELVPRITGLVAELKRVETGLGEEHNLVLFRSQMGSPVRNTPYGRSLAHLKGLAEHRQEELRKSALALGERLFVQKPQDFIQHFRHMRWTADRSARRRQTVVAFRRRRTAADRGKPFQPAA